MKCFCLVMLMAVSALAQPESTLRPVDQAVEDLDPLARSLRQLEFGLGRQGQQTQLYEPISLNGAPIRRPGYIRISPGVTARLDRIDYLVRRGRGVAMNVAPEIDGEFIEVVPPNTIFDLRPLHLIIADAVGEGDLAAPDARIDARLDFLVNARVDNYIDHRITSTLPSRRHLAYRLGRAWPNQPPIVKAPAQWDHRVWDDEADTKTIVGDRPSTSAHPVGRTEK